MRIKFGTKSIVLLSVVGLILLPSLIFSQDQIRNRIQLFSNWSVNANFGPNLFFGDIQQNDYIPEMEDIKMAYGIVLRKKISPVFGFGGQLLSGRLHGHKKSSNSYFDADVFEYGMNITVNFSNLLWPHNPYRKLSVYGVAGIGLTKWKTILRDITTKNIVKEKGQGGFKDRITETVIPLGLGFEYKLSSALSLNLESTFRTINTDLLDLVKGGYKYDRYNYNSFGITLYLDKLKYVSLFSGDPNKQRDRIIKKQEEGKTKENRAEQRRINKELRKSRKINKRQKQRPKLIEYGTGISFAEPEDTKIFKSADDTQIKSTSNDRRSDTPEYEGRFQIIGGTAGETYMPEAKQTEAAFSSTGPLITRKITSGPKHSKRRSRYSYPATPSFTRGNSNNEETTSESNEETSTQVTPQNTKQIKTLVFRVQILASNTKLPNTQQIINKYNILRQIFEYHINNLYRYSVGAFRTFPEASTYCQTIKNKGILDAFVVAYKNGIVIPIKEAFKN